ncbi:MAG: nitrous oxide reductase family maturation protein NosD [Candidatus Thorarchaeota archaeon]
MEQDVRNDSRFCQIPSGSKKGLNQLLRPRTKFVAIGLSFILTTTGLVYYLMQPSLMVLEPWEKRNYVVRTPHDAIAIDGDANFTATALLEGWPGDGSPESPFIFDGLKIDFEYEPGDCISISSTRVSFIIRNCNLTGAGFIPAFEESPAGGGIILYNTSNGVLVNNICNYNIDGIILADSDSNIVVNNICNRNDHHGIYLWHSNSNTVTDNTCKYHNEFAGINLGGSNNTVANNTCNNNMVGIKIGWFSTESDYNIVMHNICNNNTDYGIRLIESDFNTVADNTCNNNRIGIYLDDESESNTMENNTFSGNTEHDIFHELARLEFVAQEIVWFLAGSGMILVVVVIAVMRFRRMEI